MEALECILNRRSIRKFKAGKLDESLVVNIIHYAKYSPSWAHTKVVRYIFIENHEIKSKIASYTPDHNKQIIENAPGIFAITAIKGRSGYNKEDRVTIPSHSPEEWLMFDSGIAAQTLCLAAYSMGVGTVIMGGFQVAPITKLIKVPENQILVSLIAAGYPDESPIVPKRKNVSDILTFI